MLARFDYMQIFFLLVYLPFCALFGPVDDQKYFILVFLIYLYIDAYYKKSDSSKQWFLEKIKDLSLLRILALQSLMLAILIYTAYASNSDIWLPLIFLGISVSILFNEPLFEVALRRSDISSTGWNNVFEFLKVVRDFHLLPLILYGCLVLNFNYQKSGLWWELAGVLMMIILMAFTFSTVNKINSLPNGLKSKFSEF